MELCGFRICAQVGITTPSCWAAGRNGGRKITANELPSYNSKTRRAKKYTYNSLHLRCCETETINYVYNFHARCKLFFSLRFHLQLNVSFKTFFVPIFRSGSATNIIKYVSIIFLSAKWPPRSFSPAINFSLLLSLSWSFLESSATDLT